MSEEVKEGANDQKQTVPRCGVCGFRIRGENHEEGMHHKMVAKGKYNKGQGNPDLNAR